MSALRPCPSLCSACCSSHYTCSVLQLHGCAPSRLSPFTRARHSRLKQRHLYACLAGRCAVQYTGPCTSITCAPRPETQSISSSTSAPQAFSTSQNSKLWCVFPVISLPLRMGCESMRGSGASSPGSLPRRTKERPTRLRPVRLSLVPRKVCSTTASAGRSSQYGF